MLKQNAKKAHLIYGCVTAVLVVALGIVLILSCLDIYRADPTGDPYSPATISAHFHDIAILVYCTVAAILGGVLMNLFLPVAAQKPRPIRDHRAIMRKAAAKAVAPSAQEQAQIKKEALFRRNIIAGCAGFFAGLMAYPAFYVFRFHDYGAPNPTAEVMKTTLIVFIPALLGLIVCHIAALQLAKSYQQQTDIYKKLPKAPQKPAEPPKTTGKTVIRCAILVAALILIVMGIANGTADDVLAKAAAICTECIGLG